MPDDIDHEDARRTAALRQPNHVLSGPYMDLTHKLEAAHAALHQIRQATSIEEAKHIAAAALPADAKVLPFAKLKDVSDK